MKCPNCYQEAIKLYEVEPKSMDPILFCFFCVYSCLRLDIEEMSDYMDKLAKDFDKTIKEKK